MKSKTYRLELGDKSKGSNTMRWISKYNENALFVMFNSNSKTYRLCICDNFGCVAFIELTLNQVSSQHIGYACKIAKIRCF